MTARRRFGVRTYVVAARRAISSGIGVRVLTRPRSELRGQSLAEFAIVIPVLLLLTMIALDFGRIYLGYINLQNMSRAAANFAANNSEAWLKNDTATITKYRNQVINDAAATNCTLNPAVPADPTFTDVNGDGISTGLGDRASVAFTCTFKVITPIVSRIVGSTVPVSVSAVFPVKSGQFAAASVSPSAAPGPVANFSGSPTSLTTGSSVVFTDSSTGSPTGWSWTFGDGATSTLQNPTHPYSSAGTYTVSLTANNANGSSTFTRTNYITVSNPAPVANFTANKTNVSVNEAVTFTDMSTGSPTAWAWTFGDGGTSSSGPVVSHGYSAAGTYTVTLTVTSASGTSSVTKSNYIVVSAATCTVPDFVGPGTTINKAQGIWNGALFTTTIQEQAGHSKNNYTITFQSIVGGQKVACNSTITVNG